MITKIEVPNVDDHSVDPKDYDELDREFRDISAVFMKLSHLAFIKRRAMLYRSKGEIERAQIFEHTIEVLYENLPDWAKW